MVSKIWIQSSIKGNAITYSDGIVTRQTGAFVSRDDPSQPLPTVNNPEYASNMGDPNYVPQAKRTTLPPKNKIDVIPVSGFMFLRSLSFQPYSARANGPQSSGFVLDMTAPNHAFWTHDPKDQEPLPTTLPTLADYAARHPIAP